METFEESPEARFRSALAEGRFDLQVCERCGRYAFPPRVACPACGAPALIWRAASGRGTVHSCTVVARRAEQGGPYNVVLVDLEEGVRLMSHVSGFGGDEVPIGLPVRARVEEGAARLVFDPAERPR